ncbi:MAG: hypothetical protein QM534_19375, partial [Sediminibacterium sp.]|nr:hypothetical protein [Sediminibacterium sp.]
EDTLKLRLIYEIVENEANPLKSEPYHKRGIELCFKLLKSDKKANVEKAMNYLPKFINNEGFFATLHKNYIYALKYAFYAQELALRTKDSLVLAQAYNNIACALISTDAKNITPQYFDTALVLSEKMKDYSQIANVINSALCSYDGDQNLAGRLQLVQKGLSYLSKYENQSSIAEIYNNLGLLQVLSNDTVAAKVSFAKALVIAKELENTEFEAVANLYLARMYSHYKLFSQSENYYLMGYNLCVSNKDVAIQDQFTYDLAKLYLRMGKKALSDKYAKGRFIDTTDVIFATDYNLLPVNIAAFYKQKRLFADSVFQLKGLNGKNHASGFNVPLWYYGIAGIMVLGVLFWWLKRKSKKNLSF